MNDDLAKNKEELIIHLRKPSEPNAYQPNMYSNFESWCNGDGQFNPALLSNDVVMNYEIKTDALSDRLFFYDYQIGIYDSNGDSKLRTVISNCLGDENRQHRTTETTYLVHSKTLSTITFSMKIAVENGLLDPETRTLESFTPNEFVTTKLPIHYDKTADCPNIKKFLSEVLEADQVPIAQEMIGYCLLKELPIHTSFVLLGPGANGKSTFLNMLNAFLGPENCSHATLQNLCEGKFELAELYGKLANVCDDLPGDALKSVGNFKNLTGNAPIMAQYKHRNPFTFLNIAKLFWACNKLPAASEDTIAYYRRFVILQFNRYFIGTKADIKLLEKLVTPQELSGLLNFALQGLERLLKQGQFSNAPSIEETRAQYIRTADSCQSFIEEQTEIDLNDNVYIPDDIFYQTYITYCLKNKLPTQKKAQLTITMQKTRPEAKHINQRILGKPVLVWRYIKFVATVATVVPILSLAEIQNSNSIYMQKPLTNATVTTNPEPTPTVEDHAKVNGAIAVLNGPPQINITVEHTCGQCLLWHKPGCTFPGCEYTCVSPTNRYANDCHDYMIKAET